MNEELREEREWREQQRKEDVRWRYIEFVVVVTLIPTVIIVAALVLR